MTTYAGKVCGVYCFTHRESGKKYVGSALDILGRKRRHVSIAKNGTGNHFHREMARLGVDSFGFAIMEVCAPEERLALEALHIEALGTAAPAGFNIQRDPTKGFDHIWTDDMRAALSAWWAEPGVRAGMSTKIKARLGSPEVRAAMSAQNKARCATPEARAAMSKLAKSHWASPEAKAAMSSKIKAGCASSKGKAARSARWDSPEVRAAYSARTKLWWASPGVRAAHSARIKSAMSTPEAKAAQSARTKGRQASAEWRAAQSARMKELWKLRREAKAGGTKV